MSREIDYDDLTIEDLKYLQDRGQVPDGETRRVVVDEDGKLSYNDGSQDEPREVFDETVEDTTPDGLEQESPAELRRRLDDMQLSTQGNKGELIQRIRENS